MVEVIYPFKNGKYPFGREKLSQFTFVQFLIIGNNQNEINSYRQLNGIFKKIDNSAVMSLKRVLKQNQKFHLLYEYHCKSLEDRLKQLKKQQQLADIFVELEHVFQTLIHEKLKAELYLQYMGVDQKNRLKVWVKPDQVQLFEKSKESQKRINKLLTQFYETQRTRIHLQIQQIFQTNQKIDSNDNEKNKQTQKQKNAANNIHQKGKSPNFIIEGNTLKFLKSSDQKSKQYANQEIEQKDLKQKHQLNKDCHLISEQRPISKIENNKNNLNHTSATENSTVDISKMSIAQKVLYYKRQKQQAKEKSNSHPQNLVVVNSSASNVSQNDLSKSSNNDSNIQIKTQMIGKRKMKITTSQQVQIQGNSDDDLQKLARQKIALIQRQRHQVIHNQGKQNRSTQNQIKQGNSTNSDHCEKYLKDLDQNSRQEKPLQKYQETNRQINSKIVQAKLKAKHILEKYGQKSKK